MGNNKRTQDNAAAVAQRSEQAAQRDEVFKAMQRAISQKGELSKMGDFNFARAKEWSWDSVAKQTRAVYDRCLK